MKLVGLTGKARCGKDTVGAILYDEFDVVPYGFADPLKEAAAILLNRPVCHVYGDHDFDREAVMPEWGFSMRHFLQKLGTEAVRGVFGLDFWVKRLLIEINKIDADVVVTDVRFENEARAIRRRGGVIWHIERSDPSVLDETAQAHASEAGVEFQRGDVRICNDGSMNKLEGLVRFAWTQLE
jgi:hypothetical protein